MYMGKRIAKYNNSGAQSVSLFIPLWVEHTTHNTSFPKYESKKWSYKGHSLWANVPS